MAARSDFNRRDVLKGVGAAGATMALGGLSGLVQAQSPITVGFIYVGPKDDYGYNQAHAEAAAEVKKLAGVKVVEEENVPETVTVQKAMQGMISQDGASLLFPTSFGYFDPHILALAPKYPDVRFAHCGGLWSEGKPKNAGSFFGYIDECQYLNGVIAGHMSKSKKIGFIAAKPIPQVLRNINAFTMGARSIDPAITTAVIFTGVSPLEVWFILFKGAFGDWFSWQNTLQRAAPLMLTALCVAIPARAGLKDNKGAVVIPAGKTIKQTDVELEKMNYLVEGVIGSA